jgi:hypothetical protein
MICNTTKSLEIGNNFINIFIFKGKVDMVYTLTRYRGSEKETWGGKKNFKKKMQH